MYIYYKIYIGIDILLFYSLFFSIKVACIWFIKDATMVKCIKHNLIATSIQNVLYFLTSNKPEYVPMIPNFIWLIPFILYDTPECKRKKVNNNVSIDTLKITDCYICLENNSCVFALPCKHSMMCSECFNGLQSQDILDNCFICRNPVEQLAMLSVN